MPPATACFGKWRNASGLRFGKRTVSPDWEATSSSSCYPRCASADAEAVAGKIVQAAARPFFLDGHEAFVTVSIGVSVFPDDGQDAEELMRHADAAMYVAKETAAALSASSLPSCANATTTACAWKPICDMRWNATS